MKIRISLLANAVSELIGRILGTILSVANQSQKIKIIGYLKSVLNKVEVFSTFGYRVYLVIDTCIDTMLQNGKEDLWLKEKLLDSVIHLNVKNVPSRTMFLGVYEDTIVDFLKKTLEPGMTFVDVGANIGYYSLIASHLVSRTGHVLAFEPEIKNFNLLENNIKANNYNNIHAYNCGLGSKQSTETLYLNPRNEGAHSLEPTRFSTDSSEQVTIVVFDTVIGEENSPAKKIDFVKIDVEGFEYDVLMGMKKTLLRDKPMIICEISKDHEKIFNLLGAIGYSISSFDHRLKKIISLEGPQNLDKKSDYLFKYPTI